MRRNLTGEQNQENQKGGWLHFWGSNVQLQSISVGKWVVAKSNLRSLWNTVIKLCKEKCFLGDSQKEG